MKIRLNKGFHYGAGTNVLDGWGQWWQGQVSEGLPVNAIGADNAGPIYEIQNADNLPVGTTLVWRRSLVDGSFDPNSPDYAANPEDEAVRMLSHKYYNLWPSELDEQFCWLKNCNEIRTQANPGDVWYQDLHPGEWWGRYAKRGGEYAVDKGCRGIFLNISSGDYDFDFFEQPAMLDFLRYAIEHPDSVMIGLHEYSYVPHNLFAMIGNDEATLDDILGTSVEEYWKLKHGRFQIVFEVCDRHQLGGWPMLYLSEWGWALNDMPSTDEAMAQIVDHAKRLTGPYQKYINGGGTWYLGVADVFGEKIAAKTNSLLQPCKDTAVSEEWDVAERVPACAGELPPIFPPPAQEIFIPNHNFSDGWNDMPPVAGDLINQQPDGYTIYWHPIGEKLWAVNQKSGEYPECATIPECLHKLNGQLPPSEQLGGSNALVLSGTAVYKMFARGGPWGAVLSHPLAELAPNTNVRVTVPVQVHYQSPPNDDSPDDMEIWLTAGDSKEVFLALPDLPDRTWVNLQVEAVTDGDGRLPIGLRVQTKWANNRDVFTDKWQAVYTKEEIPDPEEPEPAPCDCDPRIQYKRRYHVYPQDATAERKAEIARYAIEHGNATVGGSADDALFGACVLDDVTGVFWDKLRSDVQTFLDWGAEFYPGAKVEFMNIIDDSESEKPGKPIVISPQLSQRDGRWAGDVMGVCQDKQRTIGGWGCMLTAYTMLHSRYFGGTSTPPGMMDVMQATGGMTSACLNNGALRTAFPDDWSYEGYIMRTSGETGLRNRTRDYIDAGIPVVTQVDFNPLTGQLDTHWVLVVDYDGDDFMAVDPWTGNVIVINEVYGIAGSDLIQGVFYYPAAGNRPPVVDRDDTEPVPPPSGDYEYNGRPVAYTPILHAPADDWRWPEVEGMIDFVGLPVKFLSSGDSSNHFPRYASRGFSLVRLMHNFSSHITAETLYNDSWKGEIQRFYNVGARDFELHNEPNLTSEGRGVVWQDGASFGDYMKPVAQWIKRDFPEARLWFPGMSPGVPWTNQFVFTRQAWPILQPYCDGFAMHAYTGNNTDVSAAAGEIVMQVVELQEELNLQVPLVVSESSVNRGTDYAQKAAVYREIDARLTGVAGVQGCTWYISDWHSPPPEQAGHGESWFGTPLPELYTTG